MTEKDKNLLEALKTAHSRSRRVLFDSAAARMEELLMENDRLSAQLYAAEIATNVCKELAEDARKKLTNMEENEK